jgi:hypothetical protein
VRDVSRKLKLFGLNEFPSNCQLALKELLGFTENFNYENQDRRMFWYSSMSGLMLFFLEIT